MMQLLGLIVSIYLYISGKKELFKKDIEEMEEPENSSFIYQYYRGMEFHPSIANVDIK